jgi:GxxExxY protein
MPPPSGPDLPGRFQCHSVSNFLAPSPITGEMNRQVRHDARFEEPDPELDRHASEVIQACVEVHRVLGPGYLESIYERALAVELKHRGIEFERQVPIDLYYRCEEIGEHRLDFLVRDRLIVELKAVETLLDIHKIQVRSYLKARGERLGLLINFNSSLLLRGVRRIIWSP